AGPARLVIGGDDEHLEAGGHRGPGQPAQPRRVDAVVVGDQHPATLGHQSTPSSNTFARVYPSQAPSASLTSRTRLASSATVHAGAVPIPCRVTVAAPAAA